MAWAKTDDGSIVDQNDGRVIYFSVERFKQDIGLGDCCFICGAKQGSKPFNDEHVIPRWVLRKFGLFRKTVTLPNGTTTTYDKYKIPCCVACNTEMSRELETPISKIIAGGSDAVARHIAQHGPMKFSVWLGALFLKIHLRDKLHRTSRDLRVPSGQIADAYDWAKLHHLHCIVRCFYTNAIVQAAALGTFFGVSSRTLSTSDDFDLGDLYATQTIFIRLGDVALYAVFDDARMALQPMKQILTRIRSPLSEVQTRELMAKLAYANYQIRWRPKHLSAWDLNAEKLAIFVQRPKRVAFRKPNYRLRGKLLKVALGAHLGKIKISGVTKREFHRSLTAGTWSFILDDHGRFIEQEFTKAADKH